MPDTVEGTVLSRAEPRSEASDSWPSSGVASPAGGSCVTVVGGVGRDSCPPWSFLGGCKIQVVASFSFEDRGHCWKPINEIDNLPALLQPHPKRRLQHRTVVAGHTLV